MGKRKKIKDNNMNDINEEEKKDKTEEKGT